MSRPPTQQACSQESMRALLVQHRPMSTGHDAMHKSAQAAEAPLIRMSLPVSSNPRPAHTVPNPPAPSLIGFPESSRQGRKLDTSMAHLLAD